MNQALLAQLSAITDEERALLKNPQQLDRTAYGGEVSGEGVLRVDAHRLLTADRLIHIRPHTRFVHFPPHTHNYVEMVYMYAGQTRHVLNGTPVTLRTGEVLLLSPHTVQEILPAGERDVAINFIILPAFFDRTLEMLGGERNGVLDFLIGCLSPENTGNGFLHFAVSDILPIQNLLENLIWTLLHDEPNRRRIRQTTVGLLLVQLANHMDRLQGEDTAPQRFSAAVLHYIEEQYREATLGGLADSLGQPLGTVSKRITRRFGCTFQELLQEKRLNRAAVLLRTTALPVGEIILRVGYENSSYFFRIFREKYGMSPAKFRKSFVE